MGLYSSRAVEETWKHFFKLSKENFFCNRF